MDSKQLMITIAALITFLVGFFGILYLEIPENLIIFDQGLQLILVTLIIFGFSFLFFGYGTPVIMFFAGTFFGTMYDLNGLTTEVGLGVFAALLAGFAAIRLGFLLLQDLAEKGNFKKEFSIDAMILVLALLAAIVIDSKVVT